MSVFATFIGGMNSLAAPEYLQDTQYVLGGNAVNRGGHFQTRPRFRKVAQLPSGRLQGIFPYRDRLYAVVDGAIYNNLVEDTGLRMSPEALLVHGTETNNHLVLSDGEGNTVVVGDFANRHTGENEICQTGLVVFGQGRIFYTDRARRTLFAGDISDPANPNAVLGVTEAQFLNENLALRMPHSFGRIVGAEFMRADSGTGDGPLVVFHEGGVTLHDVSPPRATEGDRPGWLDRQVSSVVLRHGGCGAILPVHQDLVYRDESGLTTLRNTISQVSQGLRALPLTTSTLPTMRRDPLWTLYFASTAFADNRLLLTTGMRSDYSFDSLLCMDLLSFYAGGESQATIDGLWTGRRFHRVFSHENRLYVVADDNELLVVDDAGVGEKPRVRLYTKRMWFGDAFTFSRLSHAELYFEGIKTDLHVKIYCRGESPLWRQVGEGVIRVPYYPDSHGDSDVFAQAMNRLNVPLVSSECDEMTRALSDRSILFQFCVEFTGVAELARLRFIPKEAGGDGDLRLLCGEIERNLLTFDPSKSIFLYEYDHLDEVPV